MSFSTGNAGKTFLLLLLFFAAGFVLTAREGVCEWEKTEEIAPGVRWFSTTAESPRIMRINALRIDLSRRDLYLTATGRADLWGTEMPDTPGVIVRTERQTVLNFLTDARKRGIHMIAAVNATPWTPWKKPWNQKYGGNLGLVISGGEIVDYPNGSPSLLIAKNGKAEIRSVAKNEDLSWCELALSGFSVILRDGKPSGDGTLHPRTAYGLSADSRYLFLATVDGRMPGVSEGIGTLELGEWMLFLGADDALNMDGGGSTSLVVWRNGRAERLNTSLYNRAVATSLGVCVR